MADVSNTKISIRELLEQQRKNSGLNQGIIGNRIGKSQQTAGRYEIDDGHVIMLGIISFVYQVPAGFVGRLSTICKFLKPAFNDALKIACLRRSADARARVGSYRRSISHFSLDYSSFS